MICAAAIILIASAGLLHPATHSRRYQPLLHGAMVPSDVDRIFNRACQDCHSDKTEWPWYAHVPPMSNLIAKDVRQGRAFLNLSDWQSYSKGRKLGYLAAISSAAISGEMPPRRYTLLHGEARLSDDERRRIAAWAKQESSRLR
jgi:Haem-binding domain